MQRASNKAYVSKRAIEQYKQEKERIKTEKSTGSNNNMFSIKEQQEEDAYINDESANISSLDNKK